MISVRASRIPLLLICPASHADGLMQIDSDNDAARLGDAAHDGAADYVRESLIADVGKLGDLHGIFDLEELERMVAFARAAWDRLRPYFPNPIVEQQLAVQLSEDVELTGKSDVMSLNDDFVIVNDWKSGFKQKDFFDQLRAYAILGTELFSKPKWSVTLTWLREGTFDTRSGTREQLQEFKQQIVEAANDRNKQNYRISSMCEHCPRFHDCPARRAMIRQASSDIQGVEASDLRAMTAEQLSDVYAGVLCIEKACADFRTQLKAEIERGGPVGRFSFIETQKRVLDARKAWPVFAQYLSEDEMAPAVKMSLSTLLDAVGEKAPHGQKKKAKESISEELKAAGALTIKPEKRLHQQS